MSSDILAEVRRGAAEVARRARHVKIDMAALESYAGGMCAESLPADEFDPRRYYLGHGEDTVTFILALNAINFGSGYFPFLKKREGMASFFTISSSLTEYFQKAGVPSAEDLQRLTVEELFAIFGQSPESEPIRELMALFQQALCQLGEFVEREFESSFAGLVLGARQSADELVRILRRIPFFDDVHDYDELKVPLFKRAQITAADLAVAFNHEGFGRFRDIDKLTMFADNAVPHLLRMEGVLVYDDELAERVDRMELLASGSREEVEIRAVGLHAVERLAESLRQKGALRPPREIDFLLWDRSQAARFKAKPSHKTRCVYY